MRSALRTLAVPALAVCTLVLAGCGAGESNNKDKIIGKWKMDNMPGLSADDAKMAKEKGMYFYFDFKADGAMVMGIDSTQAEVATKLKESGQKTTFPGKYKLLAGDKVEVYDMEGEEGKKLFGGKDKAQTEIKITGDNMTIKDPDGTSMNLIKMK